MDEQLRLQVQTLSQQSEQKRVAGQYAEAEALFDQAAELVPEPKEKYPIYSWLFFSLADVFSNQRRFSEAFLLLTQVDHQGHLAEQPEFHLLRGKCAQVLSHEDIAAHHLQMALQLGGEEAFAGEAPHWLALARGDRKDFQA